MILTRYLYNKEYVEYSLFLSLLERDKEEALFWTYELYFSGFKKETMYLMWKFYFTLYSAFYVNLETQLYEQTNIWLDDMSNDKIIGNIVINLASREPCIDLYCMMYDMLPYISIINPWVQEIKSVSGEPSKCYKILKNFVSTYNCFEKYGQKKIIKQFKKTSKLYLIEKLVPYACISRMFSGIFLLDKKNKLDPIEKFTISDEEFDKYVNKQFIKDKGWKIPEKRCKYSVYIPPQCEKIDRNALFNNWLFYTWESPIWKRRIQRYNGEKCETSIMFEDEDYEQNFHDYYNIEPDEQRNDIVEKWEGYQPYTTWEDIYNKYSLDVLYEWLRDNNYTI